MGKTVEQLNMPGEFLLVALRRLEGTSIPASSMVLKAKDILMAAVRVESLGKIKEKFGL